MDIFREFPYLFCCDMKKMRLFMGEFRKYKFSKRQILQICKKSGGLLACKVSNMVGFFDYMKRQHNIKAEKVIVLLKQYPEFIMQNRKDLLAKKIDLINKNSPHPAGHQGIKPISMVTPVEPEMHGSAHTFLIR